MAMKPKVIIWGHPFGTHTTSYVFYGFHRAFEALGYDVQWVDDKATSLQDPDWDCVIPGSVVLTENVASKHVPRRRDLYYILHNCPHEEWVGYKALHMKVLADFNMHWGPFETLPDAAWCEWNDRDKILLMPWATDLLPSEIDLDWSRLKRERVVHYIGTVVREGTNANWREFNGFAKAASEKGLKVYVHGGYTPKTASQYASFSPVRVSERDHRYMIQQSAMAPVIVGEYQDKNRYIPCRVFKNISFGQHPVTNSYAIYEFFGETVMYDDDPEHMVKLAMVGTNPTTVRALMLWVRDNHTFINRVQTLMRLVEGL